MTRADRPAPVDRELAERIARAAGVEAPLTAVSALGDGAKSRVDRLEFDGAEPLALKVFTGPSTAERERGGYATFGGHVPELPRVLAVGEPSAEFAHGYVLMALVDGTPANRLLAGMPRAQLLAIYGEIGRIQSQMHRVACPSFSSVAGDVGGFGTNREYMRERFAVSLEEFVGHGGNRYLAARIAAYFTERDELLDHCKQPVACHGDMHFENIFVDPAEPTVVRHVIDLEESYAGDPALDLVRTYHHAPAPGDDLLAALLAGYGTAPEWLPDVFELYFTFFEIRTWIYYASGGSRAPLSSIARRIARRVGASPGRVLRSRARRLISRPS